MIHIPLQTFAESVMSKMTQTTSGEPEDQLRGPFENFMTDIAPVFGLNIVCTGETPLPDRLGRPDYAIHSNKLLAGYVELKAPGTGSAHTRFKGRNREQWKRFSAIPNILYTDGIEWALYRNGELIKKVIRLNGDITAEGKKAVTQSDSEALGRLIYDFLSWHPIIPTDKNGKLKLKEFSALLAPLCRMLRDEVVEALNAPESPLVQLAKDWRQLLFPDASDQQFADAYAQTVTFALLLGRSEEAHPLTLESAEAALSSGHSLLSRALQILTDKETQKDISASLNLIIRVIAEVAPGALTGPEDPWLYFYEDFLAAYDPELRKNAGAYYTPVEEVRAQVRLIDDLLVKRLGKPLGFADQDVLTLDPAAGTGTYLLGVIEHTLERVKKQQGPGAVAGQATALASNLYGFEIMAGPYAVSELRVTRALSGYGADISPEGIHIYLTDTLENPQAEPLNLPQFFKPIADQHAQALKVKSEVPVIVCLGNPPYDRHDAVDTEDEGSLSKYGGWVRFSEPLGGGIIRNEKGKEKKLTTVKQRLSEREKRSILRSFIDPASEAGHGVHIKNLYNLYVYFWRWALWKVFEHEKSAGPGIVSFISASSYLDGDAFSGMREHMRRICDEIWIIDLGGEGRGTRRTENVFAIQTPVAIAVAMSSGKTDKNKPATVRYVCIEGTREAKLASLNSISGFTSLKWQSCPDEWQTPFRPAGKGEYFTWPLLTDIMPWQHSGAQFKRTWPICFDDQTLKKRWSSLLSAPDKAVAFKESRDRKIETRCVSLFENNKNMEPLNQLKKDSHEPVIQRYAYRSFDRQWIFANSRLGDYLRPDFWNAHSEKQIYITSLFTNPLEHGPALTSTSIIPDLHYFRGSYGAKDVFLLYRNSKATETNILPGLIELIESNLNRKVTPEDFLAYIYGVMAHAGFTSRFSKELETRELRVPITKDPDLFEKARSTGTELLRLHTYGERYIPKGKQKGQVAAGRTKCTKAVPKTLMDILRVSNTMKRPAFCAWAKASSHL